MEEEESQRIRSQSSSQMDISTEAIKGASPEGTKSNEDSGVETMEVDDNKSEEAVPIKPERKEAEKRKRTSSSASYEVSNEQALSVLQNIFTVKIPKSSEWPPDQFLCLPDVSTFQSLTELSP